VPAALRVALPCALAFAAAAALEAPARPLAEAHSISLVQAERAAERSALAYLGRRTRGFNELVGMQVRSEATARCVRERDHVARCSWRGQLFIRSPEEDYESLWVRCSGSAVSELRGDRLRTRLMRAGCLH
jgi:hypothetical protein